MSGKNQITGGAFQDLEGSVLANGYLTMQLSHDEQESVDPGNVIGGSTRRIPLDANGNINGTVYVWPNDQLNPASSYYIVNAYRRDGVQAWLSPQYQTVTSSPSPFNVGAWVPNNPPSGGAPVGSILLQNTGVNNQSQSILNLESTDSSVRITDEGSGAINLQAAFTGDPVGSSVAIIPPFMGGGGSFAGYTLVLAIPAPLVAAIGSGVKLGMSFYNLPSDVAIVNTASIGATVPNPAPGVGGFTYNYAWTQTPLAITWPVGSFANNSQIYLSNRTAITIDTNHDYYIAIYLDPASSASSPYNPTGSGSPALMWNSLAGYITGNHAADSDASSLVDKTQGVVGVQQVLIA